MKKTATKKKSRSAKKSDVSSRTFYRSLVTIEVISDVKGLSELSLEDLNFEITDGGSSGMVLKRVETEIDGANAAKRLLAQGSDPGFFQLTETGQDDDSAL